VGTPAVLHVQDIYPESLLEKLSQGFQRIVGAPLLALDRYTAQNAARLIVISDNMRRRYIENRGVAANRVKIVYNWQDESLFASPVPRAAACSQLGVPADRFTFLYLGNIGRTAGVRSVIKAFARCGLENAQLVLAGGGSEKLICEELAAKLRLKNVLFVEAPDAAVVPTIQNMADVLLLPMKKGTGLSSIPSKLAAYLFSAKPIIASVDRGSDTARFIAEAGCGWIGEAEDIGWIAAVMAEAASLPPERLAILGAAGRKFGLRNFSRRVGASRLTDIVMDAVSGSAKRAAGSAIF